MNWRYGLDCRPKQSANGDGLTASRGDRFPECLRGSGATVVGDASLSASMVRSVRVRMAKSVSEYELSRGRTGRIFRADPQRLCQSGFGTSQELVQTGQ
jgi:hypothetical protein